jgi:hypothetical protein
MRALRVISRQFPDSLTSAWPCGVSRGLSRHGHADVTMPHRRRPRLDLQVGWISHVRMRLPARRAELCNFLGRFVGLVAGRSATWHRAARRPTRRQTWPARAMISRAGGCRTGTARPLRMVAVRMDGHPARLDGSDVVQESDRRSPTTCGSPRGRQGPPSPRPRTSPGPAGRHRRGEPAMNRQADGSAGSVAIDPVLVQSLRTL